MLSDRETGRSLIFKTLQTYPTNRTCSKGLLTYRTFQFSMSSGCFHPKNLSPGGPNSASLSTADRLPLSPGFAGTFPNQGDKKSEEPVFLSNSASQTLVKFAGNLPELRRLSTLLFCVFQPVLLAATSSIYQTGSGRQQETFSFFVTLWSPLPTSSRKERDGENSESTN
jgi:hypothetical protein